MLFTRLNVSATCSREWFPKEPDMSADMSKSHWTFFHVFLALYWRFGISKNTLYTVCTVFSILDYLHEIIQSKYPENINKMLCKTLRHYTVSVTNALKFRNILLSKSDLSDPTSFLSQKLRCSMSMSVNLSRSALSVSHVWNSCISASAPVYIFF
jgi:hypothetical protein